MHFQTSGRYGCLDSFLTGFRAVDTFLFGKEHEVKTEVSIEYCVV